MSDAADPSTNAATLHGALVEQLLQDELLASPAIEAAFRAVPRHLFLPGVPLDQVYRDGVVRTKEVNGVVVSSSSQPAMMAIMLEQLALAPGQRVLEIGAATGYNAALMAHIVGATGHVVTLDIDDDLATQAQHNLATAGVPNVTVVRRDGWQGYAEAAPFDRIILTVAADDLAPAWHEQLAPNGRLLLPLVLRAGLQKSVAFERRNGSWASVSVRDCGFMTLRGAHAVAAVLPPATDAALGLTLHSRTGLSVPQLAAWLSGPSADMPTSVQLSRRELWRSLALWLALYVREPCVVVATGEAWQRGLVPGLWVADTEPPSSTAYGAASALGLGLLWSDRLNTGAPPGNDAEALELVVRSYGSDGEPAAQLGAVVRNWDAAGRPTSDALRIRAFPAASQQPPTASEVVLERPSCRLLLELAPQGDAAEPSIGG